MLRCHNPLNVFHMKSEPVVKLESVQGQSIYWKFWVKCSEVKAAQSCQTLCNPMDYSLPGTSVHGDSPGKNTGMGSHFLL